MARPVKGVAPPKSSEIGEVIDTTYLENTSQGHNKFYLIETLRFNDKYHLRCKYGKIGSEGSVIWHLSNGSQGKVRNTRYDLEWSKQSKGYLIKNNPFKGLTPASSIVKAGTKQVVRPTGRFARILENK